MNKAKLILMLVLVVLLALLIFQNTVPFPMRFLWFSGEVPAILLLFLTALGGFILGLITALLMKRGAP